MAREPRQHVENGIYHVTMRGNHRQRIFYSSRDHESLDGIVAEALQQTAASVHAYCWMTNHIHLLVQVGSIPLGVTMQRICTKFARRVQSRLATTGHLFERRYFAQLVDVDAYLLQAIRYVHLNPVHAGLTASPDQYPWSSHGDYLGHRFRPWVNTSFALRMLHPHEPRARAIYSRFVQQGVGSVDPSAPTPKWSARESLEEHVLVRDERQPPARPPSPRQPLESLAQITASVCQQLGVTPEELSCASRARRLVAARAEVARRAIDQRVASLSEVARRFGRSVAAMSRCVEQRRRTELGRLKRT